MKRQVVKWKERRTAFPGLLFSTSTNIDGVVVIAPFALPNFKGWAGNIMNDVWKLWQMEWSIRNSRMLKRIMMVQFCDKNSWITQPSWPPSLLGGERACIACKQLGKCDFHVLGKENLPLEFNLMMEDIRSCIPLTLYPTAAASAL